MPQPKGTLGNGTTIGHGTVFGTYTTIASIKNIDPPGVTVGSAETTTYADGGIDQFIPGFTNGGECDLELLYITAQTTSVYALSGQPLYWIITLPDTHTWTFTGFVDAYKPKTPLKQGVSEMVKIKVTSQPVYT